MVLQSSGAISLNDVQTEFGGTNPIGMNEYYAGGANVSAGTGSIPTTGTISLNQFYGTQKVLPVGRRSVNLNFFPPSSTIFSSGWVASTNGALLMARSILWACNKTSGAVRVYYVHAESNTTWTSDVQTKISSFLTSNFPSVTLTFYIDSSGAPNISTLTRTNYDVAFVSSNGTPGESWGAALESFANAGGGIVLTTFANASQTIPSFSYPNYTPIQASPGNQGLGLNRTLNTGTIVTHFITTGLSSFDAGSGAYGGNGVQLNSGATNLASYTSGTSLLAVQERGNQSTKIYIFAEDSQAGVNVIVSNIQSVVSSLGLPVTVSGYGGSGSGTLAYDSTVDVVFYWNNNGTPTGRGTQLQTYLDNGKGLVIGVFAHTSLGGPWTTGLSTSYQISNPGTYTFPGSSYSQTNSTNHPILTGVSSVDVSYYNQAFTTQNSATAIGSSPSGGIVNYRDYGTNRRVDINTWYGNSSSDTTTSGRTRLLLNACLWAAKRT
jgi:hypothetical protein